MKVYSRLLHVTGGGTFIRLVEEGHDVSVAYQTSGSIAVSDEEALRFAEFAHSFGLARSNGASVPVLEEAREKIRTSLQAKRPGEVHFYALLHHLGHYLPLTLHLAKRKRSGLCFRALDKERALVVDRV